jgi:sugar O-acyltransferase (sialic acid O-acetyltransferase NeuD family)
MKPLLIIGTGGCAREVHQIVEDINLGAPSWELLGFIDENAALHGTLVHGVPVLGGMDCLLRPALAGAAVAVGVGNPALRRRLVEKVRALCPQAEFATLVHPRARIGNRVAIGAGSLIWQDAVITTDVTLGCQVIVNTCCTISHDAAIGDYVTFAPSVSMAGNVTVGEGADLGIGSTVIQGRTIGEWSIIGAGAVVIGNIDANLTVVGVPARTVKSRTAAWHLE